MPRIFERATRGLVKEIGRKELRPVKSLLSATKIRRFTLVQRKKARSRFWKLREIPLDVSLMHILEPGTSVPDAAVEAPVLFSDTVVKKQQAGGSVDAGADVSFSGEATQCHGFSFECQIVTTPHETWTELQKRKLKDPEPSFLGQCRRAATNLYVVTEIVELLKDTELKDLSSQNILGKFSIPLNIFVKGEGQGSGHKVSEKKLTVPQGSVLAYRRKQLVIKGKGWDILHIAEDDEEETFPPVPYQERHYLLTEVTSGLIGRQPYSEHCDETVTKRESCLPDFKHLQEEVSQTIKQAQLSKDTRDTVFSNIRVILGDPEALQDLMDMLEQDPLGHLSGPGGTILNELQNDSRCHIFSKYIILYLLEAIMVLSDIQHGLLAYSMEKEILSQQRDLVRSFLEPNFLCSGSVPFTLNPELLAPLQGESLSITYGLLAECGLKMELNSPTSAWEPEAKEPLCALYGALCILQHLAEASAPLVGRTGSPSSETPVSPGPVFCCQHL
ncbi:gasdermin-C-like [Saccopteryx leptura]|uniref:gasdermin-C-like n=1 Tax=Saccopteryx leptura TaxID=249018 RepID=UPI00339C00FC